MQLSLALDEYVVFDVETTGLSPWGGDEIIEIGALKIYGDEVDEANVFHSLVNPKRPVSQEAMRVNGISNEMLADAPFIEEVFPKFLDYVGSAWLVAQNAKFDMGFIMKYLVQFKMRRNMEVYDTMIFSRRAFPNESGHNLDMIARRLGLNVISSDRHRSLGDVRLTAQAFIALREKLGENIPARERWSV